MLTADCPDRTIMQGRIDSALTEFQKKIKRLEALDIPVNFDTLLGVKTAHTAAITIEQGFNEEIERLESLGKIHSATKHLLFCKCREATSRPIRSMKVVGLG